MTIHNADGTTHSGTVTKIDLTGFTSDTQITGSSYGDTITGGSGKDFIDGGKGHDVLTGGGGQDTFYVHGITSAADSKVIVDFHAGSSGDILQFDAATYTSYAAGDATIINAANLSKASGWNNYVVVDSYANIASLNASSQSSHHAVLAIASDTGELIYDADGDFTSGLTVLGVLTPSEVAALTAYNIHFV